MVPNYGVGQPLGLPTDAGRYIGPERCYGRNLRGRTAWMPIRQGISSEFLFSTVLPKHCELASHGHFSLAWSPQPPSNAR